MSTSTLELTRRASIVARAADYAELSKARINLLVLAVVAAGAFAASGGAPDWARLVWMLGGVFCVAASASAANQLIERRRDLLMDRTASRPLPAGRLHGAEALLFTAFLGAAGVSWLAWSVSWLTAVWAALTWLLYVGCYTPLKSRTVWNTVVGAVAGALPAWIGWSAAEGSISSMARPGAVILFLLLLLWQFPHFMAIAWIYRRQYALGGLKMASVVDPSGALAARFAVLPGVLLLGVGAAYAWLASSLAVGVLLAVFAVVLSTAQASSAMRFGRRLDEVSARRLLRASLLYLPVMLILFVLSYL